MPDTMRAAPGSHYPRTRRRPCLFLWALLISVMWETSVSRADSTGLRAGVMISIPPLFPSRPVSCLVFWV